MGVVVEHHVADTPLDCAVCGEPIPGAEVTRIGGVGWAHRDCVGVGVGVISFNM